MQKPLSKKGIALVIFFLLIIFNFITITEGYTLKDENIELKTNRKIYDKYCFNERFLKTPPNEVWNKTYGGVDFDTCSSADKTIDDGFILLGRTGSYGSGSMDVWLVKTDSDGDELWNKTFGGFDFDMGNLVKQTNDNGYIIIGGTKSFGSGLEDLWLIKTDVNGVELWNKTFGGTGYDYGYSVQQTNDGGFIIAGFTDSYGAGYSDVWLIKTDVNGVELWNKTYGGDDDDFAYCVQQTTDDGYILVGRTWSYGSGLNDAWLIKTDSNGNIKWTKTYGGKSYDYGYCVVQTSDEGYVIAGGTQSYVVGPNADAWLIKTDSDGDELWNKTFGGYGHDKSYAVQYISDDEYIIAGGDDSYGNNHDAWLIKVSDNGILKTTFIIGKISDYSKNDDFTTFKSIKILYIHLFPIRIKILKSDEKITITNWHLGIINQKIIFGFFRMIVNDTTYNPYTNLQEIKTENI